MELRNPSSRIKFTGQENEYGWVNWSRGVIHRKCASRFTIEEKGAIEALFSIKHASHRHSTFLADQLWNSHEALDSPRVQSSKFQSINLRKFWYWASHQGGEPAASYVVMIQDWANNWIVFLETSNLILYNGQLISYVNTNISVYSLLFVAWIPPYSPCLVFIYILVSTGCDNCSGLS